MPTEDTACKLAELVKTTENKVLLINQAHNLLNDLSKVVPPSAQDIQNTYPFLSKILLECSLDLNQLLSQLDLLKEVICYIPNAVTSDSISNKLTNWVTDNVGTTLLVNCIPSKEPLTGITISYEGRFINLSLDKIVKEKVYA